MKTTTLPVKHSINRLPLRAFFLIPFVLACFALLPATDAQCPQICDSNQNTGVGDSALISNTTGSDNTAIGFQTLLNNTTGTVNMASGDQALYSNTTGSGNTATGFETLFSNTIGKFNTASGDVALFSNTIGFNNTANGETALNRNTTGNNNTATGQGALRANTTGGNNTANGQNAMSSNTTGSFNIALGVHAGNNLTIGNNNIDIGNVGVASEANTIRIGTVGTQTNAYMAGVFNVAVANGVNVVIDSSGHLGTMVSSSRFKENIEPMDKASEAIFGLQPVTFRYKKELDSEGIPQFGLVAEDVGKVNPDLVARDEQGKPYTVRYEAVNAMLLNEFLKEHNAFLEEQRKVQEQGATITRLEQQIEALAAGLQKLSAQVELSKSAPQTVRNY